MLLFLIIQHTVLEELPSDSLVVLSDSRDVITNIHQAKSHGQNVNLYSSLHQFRKTFETLTSESQGSGAIVVSTEAQCCVTALGYIKPGDLFADDGERTGHACSSGSPGCVWKGIEEAEPWNDFMEKRAAEHGKEELADIYLNAGLIAGKAKDLLRVIKALDIKEDEDDQAVLTAFMYRNPNSIVLDYDQSIFGNNRWALGDEEGCMFDTPSQESENDESSLVGRRLAHIETGVSPLFIHSPGHFMNCHHGLLDKLQTHPTERKLKRHNAQNARTLNEQPLKMVNHDGPLNECEGDCDKDTDCEVCNSCLCLFLFIAAIEFIAHTAPSIQ